MPVQAKRIALACLLTLFGACSSSASGSTPVLTEAGVYFCSNRDGNYELYQLEGPALTQWTKDASFDSWWPRQSPDGRSMLFYRSLVTDRPATGGHNNNYDHASLWSLDLKSKVLTELIPKDGNGWLEQGVVDWSPDGKRLVMAARLATTGRWHLFVTAADASGPVQITSRQAIFLDPSWSPDGTKIVYTAFPPGAAGVDLAQLEIYTSDADGGNEVRLTNDNLRDHDPYWSPDGKRIAFETAVDPTYLGVGKWAIRALDHDGANLQSVLDDGNINTLPRWSRDGSRFLFHRFEFGSGHGFIVASMLLDGSGYEEVTKGGSFDDSDLDWFRPIP